MSWEFIVTSLVVILLPGIGVIYTLAIGLGRGFRASVAASFGCTLGISPAAVASVIGLAALLHTSALAFQILKYAGVVYLFYMAWSVLKDTSMLAVAEDTGQDADTGEQAAGYAKIALRGTLLNVLNPKLSLFFLAFLPQFVSRTDAEATTAMAGLALMFMFLTFVVFTCYGAFASIARDYVIRRPAVMRWIRRTFAGSFGMLGAKLAWSD